MQSVISGKDVRYNYSHDVDEALMGKQRALMNLAVAQAKILAMGVKVFEGDTVGHLPGLMLSRYLDNNRQEFEWEAEYEDGTVIKQFEDGKPQLHFGNIDQSKLKEFRWVSNFLWETDNADRRVVVTLMFKEGLFKVHNGFVHPDARPFMETLLPPKELPKLIMKIVKQEKASTGFPLGKISSVNLFNRYIIGVEGSDIKKILCVEPNGFIHVWHGQ